MDFKKLSSKSKQTKSSNPVEIYETLDRKHDKGPLRDVQKEVLGEWFTNWRKKKDVLIKMHTGQGKTLVGLLMLQSRLNEYNAPVVYLCPDNFLVEQTIEQAQQFGIKTVAVSENGDLPMEFYDGKSIFVTTAKKAI